MDESGAPSTPVFPLSRFIHREIIVLLILTGIAAAAFLTTKASAAAALRLRARDAATWHARGVADLAAGKVDDALDALGRARALDRDREDYHLAFADALVASGQLDAAQQVLLGLRQTHPEDPDVNISLARIEAARGAPAQAVRFFQSALHGDWTPDRLGLRERIRIDLIKYLIDNGMRDRATAQLLLLAADLPDEAPRQLEAASLFMAAGDYRQALTYYARVLQAQRDNGAALAGAGRAAFALGAYADARKYLARAPEGDPDLAATKRLADLIVEGDPLAPRLAAAERRRRLAAGQTHAAALPAACSARLSADSDRAVLAGLAEDVRTLGQQLASRRGMDHDAIQEGVALIVRLAAFAADRCGPLDEPMQAWLLIGRLHQEVS